jgi:hypothetical protein
LTRRPGEGFFYLITAEDALGNETALGFTQGVERGNFFSCP